MDFFIETRELGIEENYQVPSLDLVIPPQASPVLTLSEDGSTLSWEWPTTPFEWILYSSQPDGSDVTYTQISGITTFSGAPQGNIPTRRFWVVGSDPGTAPNFAPVTPPSNSVLAPRP